MRSAKIPDFSKSRGFDFSQVRIPVSSMTKKTDFITKQYVIILESYIKKFMTLTLDLPSEVERCLLDEAHHKGLSIESVTLEILTSFMLLKQKQTKAVDLLQSWIDDEDIEEQQETGQYLIRALDDDRLSERKLFPVEIK